MATALRGWKAGGKWIREPGNLPTPGWIRRDARTLKAGPTVTLVLGGARSGKSEWAEGLTATLPAPVTFIATATAGGDPPDPEFAARIAVHRSRRPLSWATVEAGNDLIGVLAGVEGSVLVDALGTWVAATPGFEVDAPGLCAVLQARKASTVVVSEEVGLGVHPFTETGGRFRDAMGLLNRAVAQVADEVVLVVAGRVLRLDPPGLPAGKRG
jgi:adenosyl cobinamide kinase/adenosyl cobinamide phosphate guanylyltransferase